MLWTGEGRIVLCTRDTFSLSRASIERLGRS